MTAPDVNAEALPPELHSTVDACLRDLGLPPERRDDMREELLGHLAERFRAERATGRDPVSAARHAVVGFGQPEGIRRRLLLRETWDTCRDALRLPWTVLVIVLADVGSAATRFLLYAEVYYPDAFVFRRIVSLAIPMALLQALLVVVLARFGLLALRRYLRFGGGRSDLILGSGALVAALSYWIVQRPGLFSMALSDVAQALPHWWDFWTAVGRAGWFALVLAVSVRIVETRPGRLNAP